MRVTAGAVAVLGLAVAVAEAQPGKERAAALKAPQALSADELPPIARGAVGDFPTTISGTPVTRPVGAAPPGPAWLTGDAGVAPAGGISTKASAVRPLGGPPALGKDEKVPPPPKMLDRLKIFPNDKAPTVPEPQPVSLTPPQPATAPPQPTASTAFRGTGTNGAPVFAGPPAYRWYGWGSVTPGANPLAPTGQYPKASANWYQITGATPGAFPVPVTAGARSPAGTEPPTYGLAARTPAPAPVVPASAPPFVERPEPSKFPAPEPRGTPAPTLGALPPPSFSPPAVPVPALTPPPIPSKSAAISPTLPPPTMPPAPVTVLPPALPKPELPPPTVPAVSATAAPAPVTASKTEPVAALPPPDMALPPLVPSVMPDAVVPSVAPAIPVSVQPSAPTKAAVPATLPVEPKPIAHTPSPLPTSVTADPPRDEAKWKQSGESAPRPGTWAPATAPAPLPTMAVEPPGGWQSGATARPIVARGQLNDGPADPIDALIKQMCQGRATDVEIRHTGTKKIQVCFEARTADDAKKLVSDISKRPELTPYQVDFCVLVK